jgi:hypothetical protein
MERRGKSPPQLTTTMFNAKESRMTRTTLLLAAWVIAVAAPLTAQDDSAPSSSSPPARPSATEQMERAAGHLAQQQTFTLRYQFAPDDVLRWEVESLTSSKVSIRHSSETSSSRTRSIKKWQVTGIDNRGNVTFDHIVDSVQMWQQIDDNPPVSFDSRAASSDVPEVFRDAANKVGRVLATITVSPTGEVVNRRSDEASFRFGANDVTAPLPEGPISLGHEWYVPDELTATADGRVNRLKARVVYRLESVADHLATISFRTEILTPIDNPQIHSQIVRHMTHGKITFDIARGRQVAKEFDCGQRVQAFEGPDSMLEYQCRFTERLLEETQTASAESADLYAPRSVLIRPADGPPILRY